MCVTVLDQGYPSAPTIRVCVFLLTDLSSPKKNGKEPEEMVEGRDVSVLFSPSQNLL